LVREPGGSAGTESPVASAAELRERVWARCGTSVSFVGDGMKGIINRLTQEYGGNVYSKDVVAVRASTTRFARNAGDLANARTFYWYHRLRDSGCAWTSVSDGSGHRTTRSRAPVVGKAGATRGCVSWRC